MELRDKLAAVLAACLPAGFKVIGAEGNGPRPAKEYAAVKAEDLTLFPVHRDEVGDDGSRQLHRHQSFTMQVQIYGKQCLLLADQIVMSLDKDAVLALLEKLDVDLSGEPNIDNVPALLDDLSYEPRAILRIAGQHTLVTTEDVGFIETVNGTATIEGASQTTTADFTATVTDANLE